MLEINSWNVNPNREWFVRLSDAGSAIAAGLYLTQADALAQTKRQAHGVTAGFGTALPVTLANEPAAEAPVSFFQPTYNWHLLVSGQDGNTVRILRVREFVDLDEIEHPIYRNEALITSRASAEIDAHTHAKISKDISLGAHLPTMEPGDTVRIDSSRRGKDEVLQVIEHRILAESLDSGETRLTSSLTAASYLPLRR